MLEGLTRADRRVMTFPSPLLPLLLSPSHCLTTRIVVGMCTIMNTMMSTSNPFPKIAMLLVYDRESARQEAVVLSLAVLTLSPGTQIPACSLCLTVHHQHSAGRARFCRLSWASDGF